MKLSKKILFLSAAADWREKVCGRHLTPLFNRLSRNSSKRTSLLSSPKTWRCKWTFHMYNKFFKKTTPFSKLWDLVIWSEEVAKIIGPNRFDRMRERSEEQQIYDSPLCRFISLAPKSQSTKKKWSHFEYITNEFRNEFIESGDFFRSSHPKNVHSLAGIPFA